MAEREIENIPCASPPSFNHTKLLFSLSLSSFIHYHSSNSQPINVRDILNSSFFLILTFNLSAIPMKSAADYFLNMFTSSNPLDKVEFYLSPVFVYIGDNEETPYPLVFLETGCKEPPSPFGINKTHG